MMETTITKYQVTRISTSPTTCKDTRSYKFFDTADEAIDRAKRHSTKANIECMVFTVPCEWEEMFNDYVWPCTSKGTEDKYEPIFRKCGDRILVDTTKEDAEVEPEREETVAETAEPMELAFDAPADEAKDEAPANPIKAGGPVRWYVVLKIAENRKQTRFHFKRRMFYDDEAAIRFARSRLRGGCKEAAVYLYDPVSVKEPPTTFESDTVQRDARNIMALLWNFEIYYIDRTAERDLRSGTFRKLADYKGATA